MQARIQGGCFGGCSTPGYESEKREREGEREKEKKKEKRKKERKIYNNHVMRLQQSLSF